MEDLTTIDEAAQETFSFFKSIDGSQIFQEWFFTLILIVIMLVTRKFLYHIIDRVFDETRKDMEKREERRVITLNNVLKIAVNGGFWTIIILNILEHFINIGSILAVAGVGTLAIAFGAQGLVEDIMSGFVIVFENHFSVGDYVIIDETHHGIVEEISMRTTSVREFDGGLFIIHNGKIDRLKNFSKGNMKAIVEVGVAYEENIAEVIAVLNELCERLYYEHEDMYRSIPVVMGVVGLDDSAVTIRITCDEDAGSRFVAENLLRQRIKEVFDEKGIEIPYNKTVIYSGKKEV
ncbi:mechanosensitive ion channel family protein [Eubacteriaceae bacterium ES2]|nr:mechanosensitive ion channel family protein [Eubacteriaceae bacterium ES2]